MTFRMAIPAVALGLAMAPALDGPAIAQSTDWSQAKRIDIALANFNFTPSRIVLRHGEPYVLRFTNTAKGGHDFTAKSFFSIAKIAPGDVDKTIRGDVDLHGGQSVEVRLIAPPAAIYEAHCSHFMHAGFGMKGEIVVE